MRTIFILLLLTGPPIAQPAISREGPPLTTTGAFFALVVPDLDASSQWYSKNLGLRVVTQSPKTDKVAVALLEGGGLIVELIERDDAIPLAKAAPGVKDNTYIYGVFKVGVIVDDFERTLAALKSRGVEIAFGPYPARTDQRANVIVKDNNGNLIQLLGSYKSPAENPGN